MGEAVGVEVISKDAAALETARIVLENKEKSDCYLSIDNNQQSTVIS